MELLSLNPGMFLWTIITFVLVAIVLKKIAWKPILDAVEHREKTISEALSKAETAREEAEKLLAEQQKQLASAQEEMQKLIKEGKEMAEKTRQSIVDQAHQDAAKITQRAKEDIEKERQTVIASLKQEVADIVVDATSKLVGVVVDKSRHQKIIDESIAGFGQKN